LNEAIAQTLDAVNWEALEDDPTPEEQRTACEEAIKEAERERKKLAARRRRVWPWRPHRALNERLGAVAKRLQSLQAELKASAHEEKEAKARSKREREALEEAWRMVAEADGRDRFNKLVPDIRTRLCEQWHACEMIKQYQDETALTMAIGDVLMSLGAAVPVATVAALVVKIGVKKFCNCSA
jgi:hypothetical protein